MIEDHAITPDGLPLIGIPPSAAQEVCSKCKQLVHISEIVIDEQWKQTCKNCCRKATLGLSDLDKSEPNENSRSYKKTSFG